LAGSAGLASAAAGVVCAWAGGMSKHAASAAAEVSDGFLKDMICSGTQRVVAVIDGK